MFAKTLAQTITANDMIAAQAVATAIDTTGLELVSCKANAAGGYDFAVRGKQADYDRASRIIEIAAVRA
jgi:hypothetical protein